ncbi:NAD(P)/FAD-dependent oxidoreductase [Nonomuraea sp. NPDC049152]|uniref:FAD-dependent oxidoreductase n=1 Tax=Nonomuraea sp. NPDC049152 TaxID=3154350 RepID=UPI0033CDEE0F
MRVVVIGAGVAGLALARALHGHEVEIYEEAPSLRTAGGSVTLWPGAVGILGELGLDPGGVGEELARLGSWSCDGRRLYTVDVASIGRAVHLARRELVELLAEGVRVTYGAPVVAADPDKPEVRLADGCVVRGDVLVGADGRRSVVRHALWGADPAEPGGWVTWQGFARLPIREGYMITGREGFCGLLHAGGGRVLWWFDVRSGPGRPLWGDEPDPVGRLKELFGGWAEPVPSVLAAIREPDFFPHHRHKVPAVWGRGPTTLAGDSAHTMPPTMAQGANQALEDAWALARALGGGGPVPERLRAYERARAKVVRRPAMLARTEMTNSHQPWFRLLPDRLMTQAFAAMLRWSGSYPITSRSSTIGRPSASDSGPSARRT